MRGDKQRSWLAGDYKQQKAQEEAWVGARVCVCVCATRKAGTLFYVIWGGGWWLWL